MAALFGKKKEEKKADAPVDAAQAEKREEVVASEKEATTTTVVDGKENIARVLMHPRITEKATLGTADNVYVFDVAPDANKKQIKEAVKRAYKVDAVKVRVTTIKKKNVRNMRTGIKGVKSGGKKAYVYLKKGESISVM